jgi:hypothetical protein
MQFKRKIIKFKAEEFKLKLDKFKTKEQAEKQLKEFFKDVKAPAPELNANILEQLLQHLEQHPTNTMQLTGQKVAELKGINITYLNQLVKQWEQVIHLQEPKEDDYCVYTENEAENERLAIYNEFVKSYIELKKRANVNEFQTFKGLSSCIDFSHINHKITPRIEWIKGI